MERIFSEEMTTAQRIWVTNAKEDGYLGGGAYGKVWRLKGQDSQVWAVKRINCEDLRRTMGFSAEQASFFIERELRNLMSIDHPHVVKLYGHAIIYAESTTVELFMEYCPNGNLEHHIQRALSDPRHRISGHQIKKWLAQLALTLRFMHDSNRNQAHNIILHRDLKPENIFVDAEGNIKIGDFGVSISLEEGHRAETIVGTPVYQAPEIGSGHSTALYGPPVDIYALGLILYKLCEGRLPPNHEEYRNRLRNLSPLFRRRTKLHALPFNAGRSPDFENVIIQMLDNNPSNRPSADKLCEIGFICRAIEGLYATNARNAVARVSSLAAERVRLDSMENELRNKKAELDAREAYITAQTAHLEARQMEQRVARQQLEVDQSHLVSIRNQLEERDRALREDDSEQRNSQEMRLRDQKIARLEADIRGLQLHFLSVAPSI